METTKKIFVSVGGTATERQEQFVRAVEERLRAEGLLPQTVGRNTFSADAPLKAVGQLLDECAGVVVIALERSWFAAGLDKRGGARERALGETRLATPWNQIEAAMAYSRGLPLMVIVEEGVKAEGLLERGYDWYVQTLPVDPAALSQVEFNGVLASWKGKLVQPPGGGAVAKNTAAPPSADQMSVGALLASLKPASLWSLMGALAALVAGAFALGAKLLP